LKFGLSGSKKKKRSPPQEPKPPVGGPVTPSWLREGYVSMAKEDNLGRRSSVELSPLSPKGISWEISVMELEFVACVGAGAFGEVDSMLLGAYDNCVGMEGSLEEKEYSW
jgi:hypothetical protein